MDQPKVFGPRVHTYSHAATDDGVLAYYQLVVPTVTDTELRNALTDPDAGPTTRRTTVLHLAIIKAIREHDLKHAIVCFQQISDASVFARQFPHTLRSLPDHLRPDWADRLSIASIDGTDRPHRRADILTCFATADRGVLANAKVLSEGVDLLTVHAIVIADRTASGHLRVSADYEDAYGYRRGAFITDQRTMQTRTASVTGG